MTTELDSLLEKLKILNLDYKLRRKKWLRAFILFYVLAFLVLVGDCFINHNDIPKDIGLLIIFLPMTYTCGYKDEGTKWLLWVLTAIPIDLLSALGSFGNSGLVLTKTIDFLFIILFLSVIINFWWKTYILRKQNLIKKTIGSFERKKISEENFLLKMNKLSRALKKV